MLKSKIETLLRNHVKESLSPKQEDISFVSTIYNSFTDILGQNECRQIGSLPRYTAIRPLHDLDIIYKLNNEEFEGDNPQDFLNELAKLFEENYTNPTSYSIKTKIQTHSLAFIFLKGEDEVFAVDIVPAKIRGKNEFDDDTFLVPEIIQFRSHRKKEDFYAKLQSTNQNMKWIKSDPLGYITIASNINKENSDFRKSVKFIKGWKNACKDKNENFKLKSFHLEQLITEQLKIKSNQTIFDSLFECFTDLKDNVRKPKIKDRADSDKYIDQYVLELNESELSLIDQAVDAVLIAFEKFHGNVNNLINVGYYKRFSKEMFLFDSKIPVLVNTDLEFEIEGYVKRVSGYREYTAKVSSLRGDALNNNSIKFDIIKNNIGNDSRKWKIRNDDNSPEPRGEIGYETEPVRIETTKYYGKHYAECYAIKNGICVAKSKSDVII